MKKKTIFTIAVMVTAMLQATAQGFKDITNQLRSVETGPLNFTPATYYKMMHGWGGSAYTKWKLGFSWSDGIYWKLDREKMLADPKGTHPLTLIRGLHQTLTYETTDKTDSVAKYIDQQIILEGEKLVDRTIDIAYNNYKSEITELSDEISGKLQRGQQVNLDYATAVFGILTEQYLLITGKISYIRDAIMPNSEREEQYIDFVKELEELNRETDKQLALSLLMESLYKKK